MKHLFWILCTSKTMIKLLFPYIFHVFFHPFEYKAPRNCLFWGKKPLCVKNGRTKLVDPHKQYEAWVDSCLLGAKPLLRWHLGKVGKRLGCAEIQNCWSKNEWCVWWLRLNGKERWSVDVDPFQVGLEASWDTLKCNERIVKYPCSALPMDLSSYRKLSLVPSTSSITSVLGWYCWWIKSCTTLLAP